jgi:hypothetical protein
MSEASGIPISCVNCSSSRIHLSESLSVPRSVLMELQEHARQIQEIIATLEELADKEGVRRIKIGLKQYEQGEYVIVEDPKQLGSLLED